MMAFYVFFRFDFDLGVAFGFKGVICLVWRNNLNKGDGIMQGQSSFCCFCSFNLNANMKIYVVFV